MHARLKQHCQSGRHGQGTLEWRSRARASATSCFWPADSGAPPSDSTCSAHGIVANCLTKHPQTALGSIAYTGARHDQGCPKNAAGAAARRTFIFHLHPSSLPSSEGHAMKVHELLARPHIHSIHTELWSTKPVSLMTARRVSSKGTGATTRWSRMEVRTHKSSPGPGPAARPRPSPPGARAAAPPSTPHRCAPRRASG